MATVNEPKITAPRAAAHPATKVRARATDRQKFCMENVNDTEVPRLSEQESILGSAPE